MLKRALKPVLQLMIALFFNALNIILDGIVLVRVMKFMDLALVSDIEGIYERIPAFLLFALLLVPTSLMATITAAWFRKDANLSMKQYYIKKVFKKNISEFQRENTANYISRLTNDCNTLDTGFVDGCFTAFNGMVSIAVGIWILSTVGKEMVKFAIILTIVMTVFSMATSRPVSKEVKKRSDMFDGYTSYVKEILSAFHIIKCNHLTDKVTKDYEAKSTKIQQKGYKIDKMFTYITAIQDGFFSAGLYLGLCYLTYMAICGEITAAGALTVFQGIQRLTWPVMMMGEAMPKIFAARGLSKKIKDSLKNADDHPETVSVSSFHNSIILKHVDFSYEENENASKTLTDVSMELKKNGKYLIVGPSGGGKSTLLKLLRKYYRPQKGEILFDGIALDSIKKEDYFSLIGNVEQQVFLFEDTLRNNITLYKDYSEKEINQALEQSGLSEFVEKLPKGLDSMIYENGKNVSGGERSRIVIARALLTRAQILFMDEAFAALDMDRAKEIEKTILALKNITVINVSHVIFKDTIEAYDVVFHVKQRVTVS